jgi:hypothetical protein
MQNKNEVEDPIIAWIKKPIPGENSKIFIYLPDDDEYFIEMNEGAIGGIEFSPFDGEENIMYVSTENSGLVKLDYVNQEYTLLSGGNEFNNTYVQTAPDGNVYAVSADGTHLGRVDKVDGLLHNHIIDYDDTYIHGTFYMIEDIRYFTLPENDQPFLRIDVEASNLLCDQTYTVAQINILSGVPNFELEIRWKPEGESWQNVIDRFSWDEDCNCFKGTQLEAGTYQYTIWDEGNCASGIEGTFEIVEGDAYDFEEDLLEINSETAPNINGLSDLVWDQDDVDTDKGFLLDNTIMFKHGFRINNETTLTINDLRLEFDEDFLAKVIIDPGSKLILNNCTLTNYHCSDDPKKWAGVEVWGNPNASQEEDENGNYQQGYLELMNGATIENAQTAVALRKEGTWASHGGGIVKAYDANFINNAKSVHFAPYQNIVTIGQYTFEADNEALFRNCVFEINEDYFPDSDFYKHADIVQVRKIKFKGCDFTRLSNENTSYYCAGIATYSGSISVGPYGNDKTNIEGFHYGIIMSDNVLPSYNSYINESLFKRNNIGIKLNTLEQHVTIKDNDFYVGYNSPDKQTCGVAQGFGVFLDNTNNFVIKDNRFYPNNGAPEDGEYYGIEAFNTQTRHDEIFRNTFTDLTYANHATNKNWDPHRIQGLAYYCNEHINNENDLFFTWEGSDNDEFDSGVQSGQGNEDRTAGNIFSSNISGYHIYNNCPNGAIGYYYDEDISNQIPIEYSSQNAMVTTHPQSLNAQCSDIGIEDREYSTAEKQDIENEFTEKDGIYNSLKTTFESLQDGGNTQAMQTEVSSSWPDDMWELRDQLLGLSPFLSKEVLKTAADKTEVLPESVLFEILSANPDELRKADLMDHLENKEQPLPDYMMDILRQVAAGQTAKTVLQNQMSFYHRDKSRLAHQMLVALHYDEMFDYNTYRLWLGRLGGMQNDIKSVASFVEEGNYSDALALANLFPDLYGLENNELAEYDYYMDLLNLNIALKQQNRSFSDLNDEEYNLLAFVANNSISHAGAEAKGWLEHFYGEHFCYCLNTNVVENKSATAFADPALWAEAMGLKISAEPNPANTWVAFDYELPIGQETALLSIKSVDGKPIAEYSIYGEIGQKVWDSRYIESGTYIYEIVCGEWKQTGKVVIIH